MIAEDLGLITREVDALREQFDLPGMRVLQFGFSDRSAHNYLPHRYVTNTVVYTGTHDNDTTLGWWQHGVTETERNAVYSYLNPAPNDVVWTLIRAASTSVADVCIFPVQDILVLGSEARMNTPAMPENNWTWRMAPDALNGQQAQGLAQLSRADRPRRLGRAAESLTSQSAEWPDSAQTSLKLVQSGRPLSDNLQ